MELVARGSFIDLLFLILSLRIIYMAMVRGYLCEVFKLTSLITASFFAFHYYSPLGDSIVGKISFLNKQYVYFLAFLGIFTTTTSVFSLLRLIVLFLAKREKSEEPKLKVKWILFFSGVFRAAYLSSVIIFIIYLSTFASENLQRSLSYAALRKVAPKIYLESLKLTGGNSKNKDRKSINKEVEEYYEAKESLSDDSQKRN